VTPLFALAGAIAALWIVTHLVSLPGGVWLGFIALIVVVAQLFGAVQEIGELFKSTPRPRLRPRLRRPARRGQ